MNTNLNDYKERVKRLKKAVSSVLNVECSQSQAYEILAKEENYPNWDSLSGTINKAKVKTCVLTNKEQIAQLFLVYEGIRYGGAFSSMLTVLKEQSNPVIKEGWSSVEISPDVAFYKIFEQTNLFSEEVLSILKMSSITSCLESGVKSSIEFLKIN